MILEVLLAVALLLVMVSVVAVGAMVSGSETDKGLLFEVRSTFLKKF